LIPAIKALNKIKVGKLDKGETTINIGLISGGTGINTIPEKVIIEGEIRSYQKKLFDYHLNEIKTIFNKSKFKTGAFASGYNHKKTSLLIKKINEIYSSLNIKPKYYSYSTVSDANILNSKGIEIINLGDGVENAHTTKEQIKVSDLIKLNKIILNLLSY
ncbi:MAG: peptidase dimerization domain-containing protein, partial [Candidatus Roizmanbacteria bacterium]|nr:peptidase dimerization domain-containing protein [Candidatus Roizmanbacteria bacterium]